MNYIFSLIIWMQKLLSLKVNVITEINTYRLHAHFTGMYDNLYHSALTCSSIVIVVPQKEVHTHKQLTKKYCTQRKQHFWV